MNKRASEVQVAKMKMLKQREMETKKFKDCQVAAKAEAKKTRDLPKILDYENKKKDVDKFIIEEASKKESKKLRLREHQKLVIE